MSVAGAMSHIIPNHILRVGQSTCMDHAQMEARGCGTGLGMDPSGDRERDELDISMDHLNQLILELDPTFEPINVGGRSPSRSHCTDDFSPEEDASGCVFIPRGASQSTLGRPVTPTCGVPIPRSCGSTGFSEASCRPPLPCGSAPRRRSPSEHNGTLRTSRSYRNSAASQLSTSPGSETSYMMGSYQSLVSDSESDSPESLLYQTSRSFSELPRFLTKRSPEKTSSFGPSPLDHFQGIHGSFHSSPASLAGSLTDIPVVLINGAPEAKCSSHSHPEAAVSDIMRDVQTPSTRPLSPTPSFQSSFQGSQSSMKFVMDTSKFWFRPHIDRVQAEAVVMNQEAGTFVVRDSTSYRGSFGLAMKVDQMPANMSSNGLPEGSSALVRHFLIESSAKGVCIKGSSQEPYFGSLSALVYQHTISPYALPCKLRLQPHDPNNEETNDGSATEGKTKTSCNFLYLNAIPTETLTGPCAVQRAVSTTFQNISTITPTIVNLKVTPKGVTMTDIQRKLFFRRHYPVHTLSYSGEDPDKRFWHKSSKPARIFGIVAKGTEVGMENVCHVFAEYDQLQPCNSTIELTQGILTKT
ncbi:hypothetical protein DPEC_G00174930 [Dallia pectoralis]|uniref:Uncharacterized protein n=1 Tax=Dallia pectoralis TaxID=75939 RepID=A0ACC2GE84_DALPE|nr:hypothetical protein DPEC_G00174930 [Dallia pectoralis]